jgi:broad specificity phosphatase PhoE
MRLLLIRHGQTSANVKGLLATARPGPGLTRLGRKQAAAIPDALAAEQIAALYVSPLTRTAETAAPLARARGLEPRVREGFEEIEAGELEDRFDPDMVMPGSIDGHTFFTRFDDAVADAAQEHGQDATVAVVSHGAAIRVWSASRAVNLGLDPSERRHLDNTGIVVLVGSPSAGWSCETWEGEPVGGEALSDPTAVDPTGEQ